MRDRSADHMSAEPQTLSPELVLVFPRELSDVARAALPDRPWEAYLPPPAPLVIAVAPPLEEACPDLVPVGQGLGAGEPLVADELLVAPASRHPVGYAVPGPKSGQRAIAVALLVLAAVIALSIRPVPDEPVLAFPAPGATVSPSPGAATTAPRVKRSVPPATTPGQRKSSSSPATTAPARVQPKSPASVKPALRAATPRVTRSLRPAPVVRTRAAPGGYAFGSELRLFVTSGGTSIAWFQAVTPCGSNITIEKIAISKDGTFAVRRNVPQRGGRAVVRLSGRVTTQKQIHGSLAAKGPGCDRIRRYAAVLS